MLRSGLRLLIEKQQDMEVVGEAEDGTQALELAKKQPLDLILLDLSMAGLNGLPTLPMLKDQFPHIQILVLTMHDDASYLQQALVAGASGYILKMAVDSELLMAIRAVMRGETYIHSAMTNKLLQNIAPDATPTKDHSNPWTSLSEREFDVLRLVSLGYTNAEIAEELFLSIKTVETYRARGMEKLKLQTRAQLVKLALKYKILV